MRRLLPAGLVLFFFIMQCSSPTAGGSSDHGNAKLAGRITDKSGAPAANVPVRLLSDTHNPLRNKSDARETTTDSNGYFCFDTLREGAYCISGKEFWSGHAFVKKAIRVPTDTSLTDVGSVAMNVAGRMYIDADSAGLKKGMAVYLPGLPISQEVDSSGIVYICDVPPGTVALSGFEPSEDKDVALGKEYENLDIIPGGTLLLPFRSPRPYYIKEDKSIQTELEGCTDTTYLFSAVLPSKPLDGNYIYRYSWGDGIISEWNPSPLQSYSWSGPGTYYVQCQVMRTGQYLAWSDPILVEIQTAPVHK